MHRLTGNVEIVIVEYAFANTKEDSDRLWKNWKAYAEAVVKAFCEHVGVKYVAPGRKGSTVVKPSTLTVKPSKPVSKP